MITSATKQVMPKALLTMVNCGPPSFSRQHTMSTPPSLTWDIFCRVIDNFGDIGVTWRLARQLAQDYGFNVRLWVDDLPSASRLIAGLDITKTVNHCAQVEIRHWQTTLPDNVTPGDIVIEAFACDLPEPWLDAMGACRKAPLWINLEYLSAEDWVDGCHGMRSIHPSRGLIKHFFFPGFTAGTGGLLKERDLDRQRESFQANAIAKPGELQVSLFAYPNAALGSLLDAWQHGGREVRCRIPEGRVLESLAPWLGHRPQPGEPVQRGRLQLDVIPFSDQDGYDRLLWQSDFNIVRGEDSFVRAQWARRPFLWHIYPQDEQAHLVKLEAFLQRYTEGLPEAAANALRSAQRDWNSERDMQNAWSELEVQLPALLAHARVWAHKQQEMGDLASRLVHFVQNQIQ